MSTTGPSAPAMIRLLPMGRNRIFLPQEALDVLIAEDKVTVAGEELRIHGDGRTYDIVPAVRFLKDVAGTGDPHGLLGRVKEKPQLDQLGAEHYMGSVVLAESAYEVQDGFVGYPRGQARAGVGGDMEQAVGAATGEQSPSDEALLTKFLLEKL
jgi:hypothetical protein